MSFQFAWDPAKAAANVRRHRVSFEEAATAFADPWSITIPDPDHSRAEDRFILIGRSHRDRLLVVVHVERGLRELRLISARPTTRSERLTYEDHP